MRIQETDLFGNVLWDEMAYPRPWVDEMKQIIADRVTTKEAEFKARPYYVVREGNSTWIIDE